MKSAMVCQVSCRVSFLACLVLPVVMFATGCTTRPPFFPNPDPALRKKNAEFAADAANRHYEASAPHAGNADGAAEIDYGVRRINVVNSSPTDWHNVEVWVNHQYVIFVPEVLANAQRAELLNFNSIFDSAGHPLPYDINTSPITKVELFMGGKMYNLPIHLAD